MGWKSFLGIPEEKLPERVVERSPNAVTHEVKIGGGRSIEREILNVSKLKRRPTAQYGNEQPPKRGMWVMYADRVGILTNMEPGDVATVMLVDAAGLNSLEVHCNSADLRQAYLNEIPAARRPDPEAGARLGYV